MPGVFKYDAVVMGVSAGGYHALHTILPALVDFPLPVIIVRHLSRDADDYAVRELDTKCPLDVKYADDKEHVQSGHVYFAPPDYHLLVEPDRSFALSVSEQVNYARPAVDVLFESAAEVYRDRLIGVILTGANSDGSHGLLRVKQCGGCAIVQDPNEAEMDAMPLAAIEKTSVDYILSLAQVAPQLKRLL